MLYQLSYSRGGFWWGKGRAGGANGKVRNIGPAAVV